MVKRFTSWKQLSPNYRMWRKNRKKQYNSIFGLLVIVCGLVVLAGWQFEASILKEAIADIRPMNPMSAITFILSGIWMVMYFSTRKRNSPIQTTIAIFIIVFGIIHTITFMYPSISIRMDYILYRSKLYPESDIALIPPNTGIGFILAGFVMLFASSRQNTVHLIRQFFIICILFVSYISSLGYLFQIAPRYTLGGLTPMSLSTAVTFFLLGCGLLLTGKRYAISRMLTSSYYSGTLIRASIPFILIFPPIVGYLRLKGERAGLYPSEYGVELNTMAFIVSVIIFLALYSTLENRKQLMKLRADMRLAMGEAKYKMLFNSIKEGVVSVNYNGKILLCNPSFCAITGYDENELLAKDGLNNLIPANYKSDFNEKFGDREKKLPENYQAEIIRKTGEKIWVSVKTKPLTDHNGVQYGYIATIDDITEDIMKIEDLSAFTVSAAHDLNSPLSRIITVIDILNASDSAAVDEEQKMFLDIINQTAYSMRDLLQDLLLFSKLGSEQMTKGEIDLDNIVKAITRELTPPDFKGIIINNPLPKVPGNEGAIKRLYANLISNAFKYSAERQQPCIETGSYADDGQTVYYVKDNGSRIDEKYIGELFTPFKRFHSGIDGNGMGLAIVKRIIEKHGGSIWAKCNPEGGLMVCFTFYTQAKRG